MISSAVIIPEIQPESILLRDEAASPTLKRKFEDSSTHDSKRPRVGTDLNALDYDEPRSLSPVATTNATPKSTGNSNNAPMKENRTDTSSTVSPTSRRKSSVTTSATEERSRNKRLFGGLSGILNQSSRSTNSAHKKRDEIEARTRERLKKEHEEKETERRLRNAEQEQERRAQRQRWDEESTRIRHRNARVMAGFLRTQTEPCLYFKPWELLSSEEETIAQQKRNVERTIRQELGESEDQNMHDHETGHLNGGDNPSLVRSSERSISHHDNDELPEVTEQDKTPKDEQPNAAEDNRLGKDGQKQISSNQDNVAPSTAHTGTNGEGNPVTAITNGHDDNHKDDDDHDDELVEGQEDDVIY